MEKGLRNYEIDTPQFRVYKEMHCNQTVDFAKMKCNKYKKCEQTRMTMNKALSLLDSFIDPSDPDVDTPNSIHAYQTAERIRRKYPENKDLQIVGLIHDVGKILFSFGEPTWAVVGDTYVLGCEHPKTIVYYDTLKGSPEYGKYDRMGIYEEGCGLDKLILSYGHDEYLYHVLKHNENHKLDDKYLNIIRYHSFYPWHTEGEYKYFMNEGDKETLRNIIGFNDFDLYSKEDTEFELTDTIKQYYDDLLNEYFPDEINW